MSPMPPLPPPHLTRLPALGLLCLLAVLILPGGTCAAEGPARDGAGALHYADVADLQELMERGDLTSENLVRLFLDRIEAIDDAGPTLNAIIEVNPDAIEIARDLDQERAVGETRGPLHGIPVVLKANIDTGDRMATSAGSVALALHRAADDAFHVAALRKAGAVILGKANLSEWANFRSNRSVSGWSSIGGQTRNPHVLDRNPCGSSSGSGVAVAAGLAVLAVGTETDGSIVCPAGTNGVVGIKPTLGLVSGYFGGWLDEGVMRLLDAMMAVPVILLFLIIMAALGASAVNVVIAITIVGTPGIARLVRSLTLDIRTREYIRAAETRGENPWHIMFMEILPNARGPIIIDAMLRVGYAIFAMGTLGFLGLGMPPPSPDWGSMVAKGREFILEGSPWASLWPSLAIASLVVGLNLLADGLREESMRYQ